MTKLTLHLRLKTAFKELASFLWIILLVVLSIVLMTSVSYVIQHSKADARVTEVIAAPESSDILAKTDFYHDFDTDEDDEELEELEDFLME